jgi:hypothetical protein
MQEVCIQCKPVGFVRIDPAENEQQTQSVTTGKTSPSFPQSTDVWGSALWSP